MPKPKSPTTSLVLGIPERSGFLLPAITVWTAIVLSLTALKQQKGIFDLLSILEAKGIVFLLGVAFLGIYTLFLLGHALDLISNGISERFLANKLDGFPHERVVPMDSSTPWFCLQDKLRESQYLRPTFFYEGAKILVVSLCLYLFCRIFERNPDLSPNAARAIALAMDLSTIWVTISLFLAVPAILVRYAPVGSRSGREAWAAKTNEHSRMLNSRYAIIKIVTRVAQFSLAILIFAPLACYDLYNQLIRGMLRLDVKLDKNTIDLIQRACTRLYSFEFTQISNNDRFWLPYLDVQRNLPILGRRIDATRKSASFCRNQSAACLIASLIFAGVYRSAMPPDFKIGIFTRFDFNILALALFIMAWLFHWKFLHHYYSATKMTLRAFAFLATKTKATAKDKDAPHATT